LTPGANLGGEVINDSLPGSLCDARVNAAVGDDLNALLSDGNKQHAGASFSRV
jgi:hypothetical protein